MKIAGEPVAKLLDVLKEPEDRVRYRARIELGGRTSDEVVAAVRALRLRGITPETPALRAAFEAAESKLNPDMSDRQLSPDVEVASALLDDFASC